MNTKATLLLGDCLEQLKSLSDNSIDSIVTDPPYGLSFMGKKWDYEVPSVAIWTECLRVLKPGGHLLSFAGTRTYHRMACNIEDAGFEIRDQIMWLYGSGFPKSMDVSKQIDKQAGATREVIGINPSSRPNSKMKGSKGFDGDLESEESAGVQNITAPATDEAKQWQGWGTALKPANEPIVVARKPLEAKLTVAQNVLKYGTGALNIDASRIETSDNLNSGRYSDNKKGDDGNSYGSGINLRSSNEYEQPSGRWPANVLLDEEAAVALDEQSGNLKGPGNKKPSQGDKIFGSDVITRNVPGLNNYPGQEGGASRFFYVAKASKRERNAGLEGLPKKKSGVKNDSGRGFSEADPYKEVLNQNHHPTVKPIKLMEYLIKLVTPRGGVVLDPFMGSGTTGVAAVKLETNFIGCEREEEYLNIAKARISNVNPIESESDESNEEIA